MKTKICSRCGKDLLVVNFHKALRKDGLCDWCKGCRKEYAQQYYQNNRERCLRQRREYYAKNKERALECIKKYEKTKKGKDVKKKAKRKYYKSKKGIRIHREEAKRYRNSEKGKITAKKSAKKYWQSDKGKNYRKKHYESNKLSLCVSAQIRHCLKGNKNGRHWEELVNYTLKQLKQHLESLFQPGMNWNNYGKWHIDHKIPISVFNIVSYDCKDFKECWALHNLQPLWAKDNMSKGNKIINVSDKQPKNRGLICWYQNY